MSDSIETPAYIQSLIKAAETGLDGITAKLTELLDLQVIITDTQFQIHSTTFINNLEMEILTIQDYDTSYKASDILVKGVLQKCLVKVLSSKKNKFGYLFIFLKKDSQIDEIHHVIEFASSLCVIIARNSQKVEQEKYSLKEPFLFNLVYGNFKNKEDIISYGAVWNWEFNQSHCIMRFSQVDFDFYTSDRNILNSFQLMVGFELKQRDIEPIILTKKNEVIVVLPINKENGFEDISKLRSFIAKLIRHKVFNGQIVCGVGKIYQNPTELFRSYQEAKWAFELGQIIKEEVPFFSELGIERILYKHDLQDLKEYYYQVLGNLRAFDEENDHNLIEVLMQFAKHDFNLKETSEAMYIHRNTLRYNIKKIEEVLGYKLEDMNNKINIVLALKIKQLHERI